MYVFIKCRCIPFIAYYKLLFCVNIINKRIGNRHRIKYFIVFHLRKCIVCRLEMKLLLEDSLNHLT